MLEFNALRLKTTAPVLSRPRAARGNQPPRRGSEPSVMISVLRTWGLLFMESESKPSNVADWMRALRHGDPVAVAHLETLCGPAYQRLVESAFAASESVSACDSLTRNLRHWALAYVRSLPESQWPATWDELRFLLVTAAARLVASTPIHDPLAPKLSPSNVCAIALGDHAANCVLRPLEAVGGDQVLGDAESPQHWLLIADVTGHGTPAHWLALALKFLWHEPDLACLRASKNCRLADVLTVLSDKLEAVLPFGLFVEAALLQSLPDQRIEVGAAGMVRFAVVARDTGVLRIEQLGGMFLGLPAPGPRESLGVQLSPSIDVLFATDGLFDQPTANGRIVDWLRTLPPESLQCESLVDLVRSKIDAVLLAVPQHDDITWVSLQPTPVSTRATP